MFRIKITISIIIFSTFLVLTSIIKNQTRESEKKIYNLNKKISIKEKEIHESQLDFSYLSSPSMIKIKIEKYDAENYLPMDTQNFLSLENFVNIQNKHVTRDHKNEKNTKKINILILIKQVLF